jgi:hypothetical protein
MAAVEALRAGDRTQETGGAGGDIMLFTMMLEAFWL